MGLPEDKVSLLDDDNQETPPPTFVDENEFEDRSSVCRVLCVSLTYVVVLGVFLTSFAYHSSSSDEDSHGYLKGYKSRVHKMRPGEDFRDELHIFRMEEERHRMKMFPEFRSWSKPSKTYDPPPRSEKAKTARYIVHNSDWGSISTISVSMDGAPFGMAASFSDGTVANSTGIPYFYLTKDDPVVKNMESNALSSLSLSEAQSGYCKEHNWDPEEPLCSRVTVIGKLVHVGPDEEKFAQNALFSRHPVMKTWPKDHGWQTLKLEITHVWLLDYYGPATMVPVEDYFKAKV